MDIIGDNIPMQYFTAHAGSQGIRAAQNSFQAWHEMTLASSWENPHQIQQSHPRASVLQGGRVIFDIKGNDFRLICQVNYTAKLVAIRWFGSHAEYDHIDAETI